MAFFIFRRVAIGNRNSGIKQTYLVQSYEKLKKGFQSPFFTNPQRHQIDVKSPGKKI